LRVKRYLTWDPYTPVDLGVKNLAEISKRKYQDRHYMPIQIPL